MFSFTSLSILKIYELCLKILISQFLYLCRFWFFYTDGSFSWVSGIFFLLTCKQTDLFNHFLATVNFMLLGVGFCCFSLVFGSVMEFYLHVILIFSRLAWALSGWTQCTGFRARLPGNNITTFLRILSQSPCHTRFLHPGWWEPQLPPRPMWALGIVWPTAFWWLSSWLMKIHPHLHMQTQREPSADLHSSPALRLCAARPLSPTATGTLPTNCELPLQTTVSLSSCQQTTGPTCVLCPVPRPRDWPSAVTQGDCRTHSIVFLLLGLQSSFLGFMQGEQFPKHLILQGQKSCVSYYFMLSWELIVQMQPTLKFI